MCSWRSVPILVVLFCFRVGAANASEVPAIIPSAHTPWPAWVAADLAVASDGSLREDMLGQHTSTLRDVARANTARIAKDAAIRSEGDAVPATTADDQCRLTYGGIPRQERPTSSLESLTTNAAAIVSGEVLAARQGFFGGQPGTLLLLDARYLRGTPASEVLLFYPFARVQTTGGLICTKPLGDFMQPQVSDRFLIFAMGEPVTENGRTILGVNVEEQLIHESRAGKTLTPRALRSVAGDSARFEVFERAVAVSLDRSRG